MWNFWRNNGDESSGEIIVEFAKEIHGRVSDNFGIFCENLAKNKLKEFSKEIIRKKESEYISIGITWVILRGIS